jgi:hypothetical protein
MAKAKFSRAPERNAGLWRGTLVWADVGWDTRTGLGHTPPARLSKKS